MKSAFLLVLTLFIITATIACHSNGARDSRIIKTRDLMMEMGRDSLPKPIPLPKTNSEIIQRF